MSESCFSFAGIKPSELNEQCSILCLVQAKQTADLPRLIRAAGLNSVAFEEFEIYLKRIQEINAQQRRKGNSTYPNTPSFEEVRKCLYVPTSCLQIATTICACSPQEGATATARHEVSEVLNHY